MSTFTATPAHRAPRIDRSPLAELRVRRSGITFENVAPDRVLIEIQVENRGRAPSAPAELRLESAPFGAFVRWQPLTTVHLPAIEPGSATRVRALAHQHRPRPVGGFSGIVAPGLLTAAGAGEGRRPGQRTAAWGLAIARVFGTLLAGRGQPGALPPDLFDLLGRSQTHWAGNLNVWISRRPVERHLAPRLRIHPGRGNIALFCLGDGPDHYAFRIESPPWRCVLWDLGAGRIIEWTDSLEDPTWHSVPAMSPVLFAIHPPKGCERGAVAVHVTQRSSGKTAQVEFDLDPTAQGPGCYTV